MLRSVEVSGDDVLVKLDIPTHAYPVTAARASSQTRIEDALKPLGAKRVTVIADVDDRVPAGAERQGDPEGAEERRSRSPPARAASASRPSR